MTDRSPIIDIKQLKVTLGSQCVLDKLNLSIMPGEIIAIVGGSGSGKSTLLRSLLLLTPSTAGTLRIFDHDLTKISPQKIQKIRERWGVLFQENALFSSLTVLENVAYPLREYTHLTRRMIREIAHLKIALVGLPSSAATKYPSELSGGMQKRAALARAIAMDPELLFLDEPTSGLDPEGAAAFDDLVLNLKAALNLTVVIVTHDLDTLWKVADRVAFLGEARVLEVNPMRVLSQSSQPLIHAYFNSPRARIAGSAYRAAKDTDGNKI